MKPDGGDVEAVDPLEALAEAVAELRHQLAELAEEVADLRARLLDGVERDLSWLMWRARQPPPPPSKGRSLSAPPEVELERLRRRQPPTPG